MSDFTSDAPTSSVSDLSKRVRYSTGLVLGVDEFTQDQAYFMERDRLLTRALHGYGVVQGLRVHLDSSEDLLQVRVEPGLAVEPSGQYVCVERAQCAVIKDWLAQQAPKAVFSSSELGGTDGSNGGNSSSDGGPTKEVCLSVVLRYGTCATDFVPIPGEPCRSAEESRAASRLADDFSLTLELKKNRPPQVEEHAIRLLGRLLRALEVRAEGPHVLTKKGPDLKGLVTAVPAAFSAVDDPAKVSLSDLESTAGVTLPTDEKGNPLLPVKPGQETKVLRALETTWVRDTRRSLLKMGYKPKKNPLEAGQGPDGRCQPVPKGDDGVVLGTLCLSVEPNGDGGLQPEVESLSDGDVEESTDGRPHLLATRVLQEMHSGYLDRADTSIEGQAVVTHSEREETTPDAQPNLTRVIATSWTHGEKHVTPDSLQITLARPNVQPQTQDVLALAVAFGRIEGELGPDAPGRVERTALTEEAFRAFLELEVDEFTGMDAPGLTSRVRLTPKAVLPLVSVGIEETDRGPEIVKAEVGPSESQTLARGAVLILPDSFDDVLPQAVDQRIEVDLRSEFIVDEDGRAVDGTFVDGQLPTGQRPNADGTGTLGVQGGRFESWFQVDLSDETVVDLNEADLDQLTVLPNVGSAIAERILEERERLALEGRSIESPFDLTAVAGLTRDRIQEWEGKVKPSLSSSSNSS